MNYKMKKFRILMRATALAMAAVAIVACSKEKTAQQETPLEQRPKNPNDYTLAEMIEAISWEDGKAFFENQPVKDYTAVCEMMLNDCEFAEKDSSSPNYVFGWHWATPAADCISQYKGFCFGIKQEANSSQSNARGCFVDGKLVIVPTTEENGFTDDGYLAIGAAIEIQNDSIVIQEGVYTAYYDEDEGRYVAVAVDYSIRK